MDLGFQIELGIFIELGFSFGFAIFFISIRFFVVFVVIKVRDWVINRYTDWIEFLIDLSLGYRVLNRLVFVLAGVEMEEELRDMKAHKDYYNMLYSLQMRNKVFLSSAPVDQSRRKSLMKRTHMTTSLGKDILSAKTTRYIVFSVINILLLRNEFAVWQWLLCFGRMTGCISGNHGLWVCNKRLRGSK